jgi:hypothetical protein
MDGNLKNSMRDAIVKEELCPFLRLIMGIALADILQLSGKQTHSI